MEKDYVENCSIFFNYYYGIIRDDITACSYLWDEDEEFNFCNIFNELKSETTPKFLYFFTGRSACYPMNFMDKQYGMWKNLEKSYNLNITNRFEDRLLLNRFYLLYGMAEVAMDNFEELLLILKRLDRDSFILVAEQHLDHLEGRSSYIDVNDRRSQYALDFNHIINMYCKEPNNTIITAIQGYDGFSINLFKKS